MLVWACLRYIFSQFDHEIIFCGLLAILINRPTSDVRWTIPLNNVKQEAKHICDFMEN